MIENLIPTWKARLKKLRVRQKDIAPKVKLTASYFSEICTGKKTGVSVDMYVQIENLIRSMERRVEQKQEARAKRAAPPVKKPRKDRPRPKQI